MIINASFIANSKAKGPINLRKGTAARGAVNAPNDSKRQHEELMMAKMDARRYKADRDSALDALNIANAEVTSLRNIIASLEAEVSKLRKSLEAERGNAAKQKKAQGKGKAKAVAEPVQPEPAE